MGIRKSIAEMLIAARDAGHVVHLEERSNPDYPEAGTKYWAVCSCGYRSAVRRSRQGANGAAGIHLGKVVPLDDRNGGAPLPRTTPPRPSSALSRAAGRPGVPSAT